MSEDELEDLKCLYNACQAAITDGGLFTDTGVNERGENERQSENDSEMKTVSYVKWPENRQELVQTRLRRKRWFKEKCFELRLQSEYLIAQALALFAIH